MSITSTGKRVLMVGAGGVGCELLKNLLLGGFTSVTVVDLDTIELTNLNRQFLFRRAHIGRGKAEVAAEMCLSRWGGVAGQMQIEALHGDVRDPVQFGIDFFKSFHIVFNALDNLGARRHVNRVCVAASVPIIESGTAGFLGQVQPIVPHVTKCFECDPRKADDTRTYASCTIKSSPKLPVHCVVWAKEEFLSHFSNAASDEPKDALDVDADDDGSLQDWTTLAEDSELRAATEEMNSLWSGSVLQKPAERAAAALESPQEFAQWLFFRLFYFRVLERRRLAVVTGKDLWPGRAPPEPLRFETLPLAGGGGLDGAKAAEVVMEDQRVWTLAENAQHFVDSTARLLERQKIQIAADASPGIPFDKDDNDVMSWVTAASNLRCHIFGIPPQSKFDSKSLAANIIPAIATTNAVIAGLMVLEARRLLRVLDAQELPESGSSLTEDQKAVIRSSCASTYLWSSQRPPASGRFISTERGQSPAASCFVCGGASLTLRIDTKAHTVGLLIDEILGRHLAMFQPTVLHTGTDTLLFESGDGLEDDEIEAYEANKSKPLADFHCGHGDVLRCEDETEAVALQLTIEHVPGRVRGEEEEEAREAQFELVGRASPALSATELEGVTEPDRKRKAEAGSAIEDGFESPAAKRSRA